MIYEKMLLNNIGIYENFHARNDNSLKYPNEYLIRFYYSYLKRHMRTRGKVLDFGYGSGNNSVFFMERGHEVFGIEISGDSQRLLLDNMKDKGLDLSLAKNFKIIEPGWEKLSYYEDESVRFHSLESRPILLSLGRWYSEDMRGVDEVPAPRRSSLFYDVWYEKLDHGRGTADRKGKYLPGCWKWIALGLLMVCISIWFRTRDVWMICFPCMRR